MKTGLPPPPPPGLPPQRQAPARTPHAPPHAQPHAQPHTQPQTPAQVASPAAELAAREAARKAAAARGDERMMSLNARYTFRHAQGPNRPPPRPAVPLARRPPPRPQAQAARPSAQQSTEVADTRDDTLDASRQKPEDDAFGRERRQSMDTEDRGESGDGLHQGSDDAERQAKRRQAGAKPPPRRPQPPATQVLARSGLPEAATLFVRHAPGARDPAQMLKLLAAALVSCAEKRSADPLKPAPTATLLAALQVHMASQLEAAPDPLTLGEVKALLMDCRGANGGAPVTDEKLQDALLLLPLVLLNASRHRTDDQRRQAMGRLQQLRNVPGLS